MFVRVGVCVCVCLFICVRMFVCVCEFECTRLCVIVFLCLKQYAMLLQNGIPLAPMFVESGRHHLESVSRDDDGLYTCEAKNEGGLVSSSVSLDVRGESPVNDFLLLMNVK